MVEQECYVIAFESTHYALMTEKRLKEKFKVDMIPTPRSITASCGLSIKFDSDLFQDVAAELTKADLDATMFNFYHIKKTPRGDDVIRINS